MLCSLCLTETNAASASTSAVHIVKNMCSADAYQEVCLHTRIPSYTSVAGAYSKANMLEGSVKILCVLFSRTSFCGDEGITTEAKLA